MAPQTTRVLSENINTLQNQTIISNLTNWGIICSFQIKILASHSNNTAVKAKKKKKSVIILQSHKYALSYYNLDTYIDGSPIALLQSDEI